MTFYGKSSPERDIWIVPGSLIDVVDGDTVDMTVDLGFSLTKGIRVRLLGVDTAEVYGVERESEEYRRGMAHKRFVEEWVATGIADSETEEYPFDLFIAKDTGKYGRYLADIRRLSDDRSLTGDLLAEFGDEVEY